MMLHIVHVRVLRFPDVFDFLVAVMQMPRFHFRCFQLRKEEEEGKGTIKVCLN